MCEATQNQIVLIEASLRVKDRWTPDHPEYKEYYQETVVTQYQKAVDELERLVVMRLFELAKIRASGTGRHAARTLIYTLLITRILVGYKLRQQIGKALQQRSEAVRTAIERYNVQALKFNPPRPQLSWSQIVDYVFLGEFDVLRLGISDKRHEKWTKQAHRDAASKFFKLCRAREEIARLNVEVQRLEFSMQAESDKVTTALRALTTEDPPLAAELQYRWKYRSSVNDVHRKRLAELRTMLYFTGARVPVLCTPDNTGELHDDSNEEDTHIEVARNFVAEIVD